MRSVNDSLLQQRSVMDLTFKKVCCSCSMHAVFSFTEVLRSAELTTKLKALQAQYKELTEKCTAFERNANDKSVELDPGKT